jgi:hypothetical protein
MIKSIKVYGERNTNTNYIDKLIALNLNVIQIPGIAPASIRKLQRALPGNELVRDMYFYLAYRHNLGWKHTCVKTQARLNQYKLVDSNLLFLTLTKKPILGYCLYIVVLTTKNIPTSHALRNFCSVNGSLPAGTIPKAM